MEQFSKPRAFVLVRRLRRIDKQLCISCGQYEDCFQTIQNTYTDFNANPIDLGTRVFRISVGALAAFTDTDDKIYMSNFSCTVNVAKAGRLRCPRCLTCTVRAALRCQARAVHMP